MAKLNWNAVSYTYAFLSQELYGLGAMLPEDSGISKHQGRRGSDNLSDASSKGPRKRQRSGGCENLMAGVSISQPPVEQHGAASAGQAVEASVRSAGKLGESAILSNSPAQFQNLLLSKFPGEVLCLSILIHGSTGYDLNSPCLSNNGE